VATSDLRHVLFYSYATNLVDDGTNGVGDLFVRNPSASPTRESG
jgi:hypothetical protein